MSNRHSRRCTRLISLEDFEAHALFGIAHVKRSNAAIDCTCEVAMCHQHRRSSVTSVGAVSITSLRDDIAYRSSASRVRDRLHAPQSSSFMHTRNRALQSCTAFKPTCASGACKASCVQLTDGQDERREIDRVRVDAKSNKEESSPTGDGSQSRAYRRIENPPALVRRELGAQCVRWAPIVGQWRPVV
jgi:hypothetical protein